MLESAAALVRSPHLSLAAAAVSARERAEELSALFIDACFTPQTDCSYSPAPGKLTRQAFSPKEKYMNEERRILIASDSGIFIASFDDISDALGACIGAAGLILTENDVAREFFDLRSGLAGDFFQKFINYKLRVAIVLPDPEAYGERFGELAREHKSHNMIRFVRSKDEAKAWLYT